jgi:hypothetical protein
VPSISCTKTDPSTTSALRKEAAIGAPKLVVIIFFRFIAKLAQI